MKRMTLLARKDGLSTSDFRSYWGGPHAALALGMDGVSKYVQNRVDKTLWSTDVPPRFTVDGIVELHFRDEEAMRAAQASTVGQRHIPADEPNFLKGWTLCIVETHGDENAPGERAVKVMVPFLLASSKDALGEAVAHHAREHDLKFSLNWTVSRARRERLWSEPSPPDGFAVFWFASVAVAHDALDRGPLRDLLSEHCASAAAYLVDALSIR